MTTKTYDGQTARFIASMVTCVPLLSSEVMQGWIDNPQALKKFLNGLNPPTEMKPVDANIFRFTVDYSQSLEQMIVAGHYYWKISDITAKRFPTEGNGIVEFESRYFHFGSHTSSEVAIEEMKKVGWEPAKIEHMLSHGKTFPEEQCKFPIIGLGSVARVDGSRRVPALNSGELGRDLDLYGFGSGDSWGPVYRFLAVRKVSAS